MIKDNQNTKAIAVEEIVADLLEAHRRVKDTQPEDSWDRCLAEQFRVVLSRGDRQPRMLQALLSSTQDLVSIKDRDSVFLFCNDTFSRLHDKPVKEIIGGTDCDLYPAEQARRHRLEDAQVLETGTEIIAEHSLQTARGQCWYETIKRPLRDGLGEVIGVLCTERDVTERTMTEEKLSRYARSMDVLHQTLLEINAHRDFDALLQNIVERAAELAGTHTGTLSLLTPDGETLEVVAQCQMPTDCIGAVSRLGEGVSGTVLQTGEPFAVEDYHHWEGSVAPFSGHPFGRILGVPLKLEEEVIGALVVSDLGKTGSFSEAEIRLVSMLSQQAAVVLRNARLYEAAQQEITERTAQLEATNHALEEDIAAREQAEALLRIQRDLGISLSSTSDLQDAIELCLEAALGIEGLDGGGIYLVDQDTGGVRLAADQGLPDWFGDAVRSYEKGSPYASRVTEGKPVYTHLGKDSAPFSNLYERAQLKAVAVVPVQHEGISVASINVGSWTHDAIPVPSRHALEAIASQVGGAIARLSAEASLLKSQQNLQSLFDALDDFLVVFDSEGKILDVNPAVLERLGYVKAELTGNDVAVLYSPGEWKEKAEEGVVTDLFAGRVNTVSIPLAMKNGTRIPAESMISPGRWNDRDVLFSISRDITDREAASRKLEQSEERYRAVVEDQTELVCRHLLDGTLTFVNDSYCRYFDKDRRDLVGHSFWPLVPDEDLDLARQSLASLSRDNPVVTVAHRVLKPGRETIRWQRWTNRAIYDEDGDLLEIQAVGRDVTKRKQIEQALLESEERYRSLTDDVMDTSAVGIFILDKDFRVVWMNRALEQFFGLKRDQVIGQDKRQIVHEQVRHIFQDPAEFEQKVMATYDDNSYVENFECHVLRDGEREERWLEHWSQPIQSGLYTGGRIEHYSDVTDRRRAELQRDEQYRMLRTLLDTLPDFVIVKGPDLTYVTANKLYCEIYGVSEEELIGKTDFDLMPRTKDAQRFREEDLWVLKNGEQRIDRHLCETPAGLRWDESIKVPLRGPDGEIVGVLVAVRDMTDRMQIEAERDEQRRMLQALLDTTPDIVAFKDLDSVYQASSERYRALMGPDLTMERFIGCSDLDIFPIEEAQRYREEELQVMETGEPLVAEHLLDTEEGPLWFEAVKVPLRNEEGEVVGTFTCERDITERLHIEAQRDEQRRMLRTLLDTLPDGIIFKDRDLVYRVVNRSYCDFLGYPMKELVGKSDLDVWPEEEARGYQTRERELLETGEPIRMEKFRETPQGPSYREIVKTPLRDEDGNIIGVLVAAHDITALRLADARVSRRNQELAARNALASAISQSLDLEHILNTALDEVLRLDVAGKEGKGEVFLLDEQSGEAHLISHRGIPQAYLDHVPERGRYLCNLATGTRPVIVADNEAYDADGIRAVDAVRHRNLCLLLKARGRVLGCINLWLPVHKELRREDFLFLKWINDMISMAVENAQLYEAAKQQHLRVRALSQQLTESAESERTRLAQDLHDMVGQYLAALGINLTILRGMLPDDVADRVQPRMDESLKLVEQTTECIRGVMADLRSPVLDDYGLFAALEWYAERFAGRTGIEVSVKGEPLGPRLSPKIENTMFRIAQEALTNVAKHAKATRVDVIVEEANRLVRLRVSDNGVGFDPELLSGPCEEWGWGLLTISEWAEASGGRCDIDSALGTGTRITVELSRS